jgi:hypothetical protein
VRLGLSGQGPEHRGGVGVDVSQGGDGRAGAAGSRTPPRPHVREGIGRSAVNVVAGARVNRRKVADRARLT